MDRLPKKPHSRELLETNFRLKMERAGFESHDWNFINPAIHTAICISLANPKKIKLVPKEINQVPVHINPYYTKV
jgi:hypothetical protein